MNRFVIFIGVLLSGVLVSLASGSVAAEPQWRPVVTELLQQEKTGFGGLCGVVVDHERGDLWINLSDRGMFHSGDQGKSWRRVSDAQPKGRTETPGCWLLDPTGASRRMVTALVYGSPISISDDHANHWKQLDAKSSHVDWCATDWTDREAKFILTLKHEAGGLLLLSTDGGQTFAEVGRGYGTGWVFDGRTAVVAKVKSKDNPKAVLVRTTDRGATWQPCGDFNPVGVNSAQALPKWRDGRLYWLTDDGLIVTADQGATWKSLGRVKDAQYGPIFGRDAQHLLVLTKGGIVESTDGGANWSPPLAPPKELKGIGGLSWLEYDPRHDVIYLMKMGSDLYQLRRTP